MAHLGRLVLVVVGGWLYHKPLGQGRSSDYLSFGSHPLLPMVYGTNNILVFFRCVWTEIARMRLSLVGVVQCLNKCSVHSVHS